MRKAQVKMELIDAIRARHSVRKYSGQPIEAAKVSALEDTIARINTQAGLNIQLVLDEPKAFSTGMWKYGQFSGVRNYFVMAAPKGKETEEKIGYFGEELVLLSQTDLPDSAQPWPPSRISRKPQR